MCLFDAISTRLPSSAIGAANLKANPSGSARLSVSAMAAFAGVIMILFGTAADKTSICQLCFRSNQRFGKHPRCPPDFMGMLGILN